MMVGDDHIQPDGGSEVHLLVAGDAAVHGDHQRGALVPQALDGLLGQAIALLDPAGNMPQAADAAAFEIVHQQNRGSDAVHVVVAEHGDGLPWLIARWMRATALSISRISMGDMLRLLSHSSASAAASAVVTPRAARTVERR